MRYTASKEVNEHIDQKLEIITNEIKKGIKGLIAIILMGGFGCGEGAAIIRNKEVHLINDFDIYVITKKQIKDSYIEEVAKRCSRLIGKGGLEHPEYIEMDYSLDKFFHVDIRCLTIKKLRNMPPLKRYYDMSRNSTVIYGNKNILKEFREIKELPLAEALRLTMNRLVLLLSGFKLRFIKKIKGDDKEILLYYLAKCYLTVCESILILLREYKPGYMERAKHFREIYAKENWLKELYPDLDKKIIFWTKYKLNPDSSKLDPIKEYFECREILGRIYKLILEKILREKLPEKWIDLYKLADKKLYGSYFLSYADYYSNGNRFLSWIMVKCANTYLSLKYLIKIGFYPKAINFKDPGTKILLITPLVVFGFNRNGEGNMPIIKKAAKELEQIYPKMKVETWEDLKRYFMKPYKNYYLQRFI